MSRVIFQIGSVNSRKHNQSIKAFLNEEVVSWTDNNGKFLTTHKDRVLRNMIWFMYDIDLTPQDILRLEVKTYLTNIGIDEDRTFETLYQVDEEVSVKTIEIPKVGFRGYPLIKGRVIEIGSVSEGDKRKAELDDFVNGEDF